MQQFVSTQTNKHIHVNRNSYGIKIKCYRVTQLEVDEAWCPMWLAFPLLLTSIYQQMEQLITGGSWCTISKLILNTIWQRNVSGRWTFLWTDWSYSLMAARFRHKSITSGYDQITRCSRTWWVPGEWHKVGAQTLWVEILELGWCWCLVCREIVWLFICENNYCSFLSYLYIIN